MPTPEILISLKLGAAIDRGGSAKGMKDSIDVLGLLFYSELDLPLLKKLLAEYNHINFINVLTSILNNFDKRNLNYHNLNEKSFSKLKSKYLAELKKL